MGDEYRPALGTFRRGECYGHYVEGNSSCRVCAVKGFCEPHTKVQARRTPPPKPKELPPQPPAEKKILPPDPVDYFWDMLSGRYDLKHEEVDMGGKKMERVSLGNGDSIAGYVFVSGAGFRVFLAGEVRDEKTDFVAKRPSSIEEAESLLALI